MNKSKNDDAMVLHGSTSSLVEEVKAKQNLDFALFELKAFVKDGKIKVFS